MAGSNAGNIRLHGSVMACSASVGRSGGGRLLAATGRSMNKGALSESDICDKYIRPAMERAGWHAMEQIYREYPVRAGRVVVRGRKARRDASTVLRADYNLFFKTNIPLAVVEAKDNQHAMGAGMAQAITALRPRIPDFDTPRRGRRLRQVGRRRAVHLQDHRRRVRVEHGFDPPHRPHEVMGQLGIRRLAYHDHQPHAEVLDRGQLVGHVADAAVVGDGHAAGRAAVLQPLLVAAVGREQVAVALDLQAGVGQDARKLLSEVAVGEPDPAHAARLYNTACSISSRDRS
jgi:hypothetical protein